MDSNNNQVNITKGVAKAILWGAAGRLITIN